MTQKQAADFWYQSLASVLHRKVRIIKNLIWWKVRTGYYTSLNSYGFMEVKS